MKRAASLTELGFLLIKAGLLDAPVHLIGGWNFADSLALCWKRGPVATDWKMRERPLDGFALLGLELAKQIRCSEVFLDTPEWYPDTLLRKKNKNE